MGNFKPRISRRRVVSMPRRAGLASLTKDAKLPVKSEASRIVSFDIVGNPTGKRFNNPLAKSRFTRGQQWTPAAHEYVAWKKHVVDAFINGMPAMIAAQCAHRVQAGLKPIPKSDGRVVMHIFAQYKNNRHPDTENVFGSIADALFQDDTNLRGSFDFSVGAAEAGRVRVEIFLPDIF